MGMPSVLLWSHCSGGPGLYDPCEKDPTDVFECLSSQQREDITVSAQVRDNLRLPAVITWSLQFFYATYFHVRSDLHLRVNLLIVKKFYCAFSKFVLLSIAFSIPIWLNFEILLVLLCWNSVLLELCFVRHGWWFWTKCLVLALVAIAKNVWQLNFTRGVYVFIGCIDLCIVSKFHQTAYMGHLMNGDWILSDWFCPIAQFFCFFPKHALRLLALGQIHKILDMEPLPSTRFPAHRRKRQRAADCQAQQGTVVGDSHPAENWTEFRRRNKALGNIPIECLCRDSRDVFPWR